MLCASCGEAIELPVASANEPGAKCPKCEAEAILAGKYRLIELVGRGGNGVTYRAERIADGGVVAVKEMPLGTAESLKAMELFEREAKVLKELHHPAIPRYEDDFVFGEGKATSLYLVQEFVTGRTIAAEAKEKRYEAHEVWSIVAELADVLAYLHKKSPPVVHRDIKPANVMRREGGALALIDFGSVRDVVKSTGGSTVAGTFGYMAPEQLAGRSSPASDLYALGALACALLARKEADAMLDDEGRLAVRAHAELDPESLSFIDELTAHSAKERPESALRVSERARELARAKEEPRRTRKERKREARARAEAEHREKQVVAIAETEKAPESGSSKGKRAWTAVVVAGALVAFAVPLLIAYTPSSSTPPVRVPSSSGPGTPELYARPLALDIDDDGVEDVITVVGVDQGPNPKTKGNVDTWGKDNGRYVVYVQALSGKTGKVLYALGDYGTPYSSLGVDKKERTRIALAARDGRLAVVRIAATETDVSFVDLKSGAAVKNAKTIALDGLSCNAPSGVYFSPQSGDRGVVLDLATAAVTPGDRPKGCAWAASPQVTEVPPQEGVTNRNQIGPFFAESVTLRSGKYAGKTARVRDGLAVLTEKAVTTPSQSAAASTSGGPVVSYGDVDTTSGSDNGKLYVVGVEVATGDVRFQKSLSSLGLLREAVARVDVGPAGPMVVLTGEDGIVLLDAKTGASRFRLGLPQSASLAQYTLSPTRAYLHVFGYADNVVYGNLSKKLESRILVVDLAKGTYVRSIPDAPIRPRPPPVKTEYDFSAFRPITGCTCSMAAPVLDAGTVSAVARVGLRFRIGTTTETGGRKFFGASYALDVDGKPFLLPHYDERRENLAPPRTLEGDVPLALACGDDTVVVAHEHTATAWSLVTKDELWTVELPESRGESPTTIGGQATIRCAAGRIERGVVHVPTLDGKDLRLSLRDGSAGTDAGTHPVPSAAHR